MQISDESIRQIFSKITDGFFENNLVKAEFREKLPALINCTVATYNQIVSNFLPIPKKSHYLFNLRDLSKVFQGLCLSVPKTLPKPYSLLKLWIHEMNRVFRDRLIETADENTFDDMVFERIKPMLSVLQEELKKNESVISGPTEIPIKKGDRIMFCDFVDKENETRV